jgi:hypothetical protein
MICLVLAEISREALCLKYLDGAKRATAAAVLFGRVGYVDMTGADGDTGAHAAICGAFVRSVRSFLLSVDRRSFDERT